MRDRLWALRLWFEDLVPWATRYQLREERDHAVSAIKPFAEGLQRASEERRRERERAEAAEGEISDIRSAASMERTKRIEEHEALRRLMFGLAHGLEGSLRLVNSFITQLPEYTPDQAEVEKVFAGLNDDVVATEEAARRLDPRQG